MRSGPFVCLAVGGGNGAGAAFVGAPFLGTRGVGPGLRSFGCGWSWQWVRVDACCAERGCRLLRKANPQRYGPRSAPAPSAGVELCTAVDKRTAVGVARPCGSPTHVPISNAYRSPTPVAHRCACSCLAQAVRPSFTHQQLAARPPRLTRIRAPRSAGPRYISSGCASP